MIELIPQLHPAAQIVAVIMIALAFISFLALIGFAIKHISFPRLDIEFEKPDVWKGTLQDQKRYDQS